MKIQRIILIWTAILAITIAQFSCEKKGGHHRHEQAEIHATDTHHAAYSAPHGGTLVVFGDEFGHILNLYWTKRLEN